MYPDWVSPLIAGLFAIWLSWLSFLIWQQNKFLNSLFPKSGERDIRKKFEELIKTITGFDSKLANLDDKVTAVEAGGMKHVQKVGITRFNPFGDTGGDQSFTACLLDDQGSGIVITSLHARSGTRIFAKPIIKGKGEKYELSKEEETVIKKALLKT